MNLNKLTNILLVIIPTSLTGGVLAVASVAAISFIDNMEKPKGLFPYNELVTNFSESNDPMDKKALNYYQNNTVSLQYTFGGGVWHFGTAWYWGIKDAARSYFATNLHVIDDLLNYDNDLQIPYKERFSLKTRFPIRYQTYNNNNSDFSKNPILENLTLEKINVEESISAIAPVDKHLYSDLVIFSTTTRLPGVETLNFIDTKFELDSVLNNLSNLTFYISGFPYHDKPTWTTGKYKWNSFNNMEGYNTPPSVTTARILFGANYFNSKFSLAVDATGLLPEDKNHYSYARQVIFPGLNFAGGSSGSLVTVLNELTGELQPLGIYWGVYQRLVSKDNSNTVYDGGIDLFYADKYKLHPTSNEHFYNNTII